MRLKPLAMTAMLLSAVSTAALAQVQPWMNAKLSPDERARLLDQQMTEDERIAILHGPLGVGIFGAKLPAGAIGSAGFIPGNARLGIPALQESDASLGVANPANVRPGDGATPLPSGLAMASSFDPDIAYAAGSMVGHEAWSKGLNVLLGGGVDLIRDPRNGRNFEYYSEDPLLSGLMAGEAIRGTQEQHVVSTIKHFALNDQETGRMTLSANIGEAAARESDLLAFEIAIEGGRPGSVMCAYNRVNSVYACENDQLLNKTLKGDWAYPGWVMSDWGAVHSVKAAANGLDQESGEQLDGTAWFNKPLKAALASGEIPAARVSDMSRRILRSMFAAGLFDHPATKTPIDYDADNAVAKRAAEEGIVLLSNPGGLLPLAKTARSIVVIGGDADAGVLSGAGSSQVVPVGGPARTVQIGGEGLIDLNGVIVYDRSSPLAAIKAKARGAHVTFEPGRYPKAAAEAAKAADVAIVFANQWMTEGADAPDLTLPSGQDALIAAVTKANPHTIVVLQTGGPVLMPWLDQAGAVVEAWYSGAKGGEAIADVLFGDADATGRLPITFPASEAQLPRPDLPGVGLAPTAKFDVDYAEGSEVGYRWFAQKGLKPLFPFGFGLSYTHFDYSGLKVTGGQSLTVRFDVKNTGGRPGSDTPQVYLTDAAGKAHVRLIGFQRVALQPGESRTVTLTADPRLLASFDEAAHRWRLDGGVYHVAVGASSADMKLTGEAKLAPKTMKP
ncbi:beta-glucosidase family protein [Phenylobacterium montanum]|uniref:Glycoside hydrolase family 3 C-terminal domain-containing protein n=1 Tax=Phenylobacterium montanum TaxID=2823693 RepID=A0A975G1Y7_9CAUL|nr:glycoside hydrolase family 3 C-terminal domain-containing protein [Caulobacter sp. S6]QUD89077.1 glycoside hydrolase family 3 C-terminal domain-containing protein [Caulobacter sp. S6]